jgi:hypothetical protein
MAIYDRLGWNYPQFTLLGSAQAPNWTQTPGLAAVKIDDARNHVGATGTPDQYAARPEASEGVPAGAFWSERAFPANQWARYSANPIIGGAYCQAITVRQQAGADTCYAMFPNYYGEPGESGLAITVVRRVAGAQTVLKSWVPPGSWWADDFWFGTLEVSGTDPVRLRVWCHAPIGADTTDGQANVYYDSLPTGTFFETSPPPKPNVWEPGSPPTHAWFVGEVVDASASRITSGQPGILWLNSSFDIIHFAADALLSGSAGSVIGGSSTLSGSRPFDQTVVVTSPTATVGAVSYPSAGTWECVATDIGTEATMFEVSDGATVVEFYLYPDLAIPGSPVAMPLSLLSGTTSLPLSSRLILPGPLQLWDGTKLVDAPLAMYDGSNLT